MKKLPIITVPHPRLRQRSDEVKAVTPKLIKLIENLEYTLLKKDNPPGVGLSAIQIAEPVRIFTLFLPSNYKSEEPPQGDEGFIIKTYLNPELIHKSKELTLGPKVKKPILEGCLSIPDIYGPVLRHKSITLKFYSLDGNNLVAETENMSGFTARVAQHEQDHLDGILFTDRALAQKLPLYEDIKGELSRLNLE